MTHDELLAKINHFKIVPFDPLVDALRAVVELHKPQEITLPNGEWGHNCAECGGGEWDYPCITILKITDALDG